jgi:hypothetical protein
MGCLAKANSMLTRLLPTNGETSLHKLHEQGGFHAGTALIP